MVNNALSRVTIPEDVLLKIEVQENPQIRVDVKKLSRVISQLVTNALDAMPTGGTLTILSFQEKGVFELIVSDSGIGIPDLKMKSLWTPSVTTNAKGMGLGLPICKRIVEAHGGEISVETEVNKGTKVTLSISINTMITEGIETQISEKEVLFLR
jgi:signal transduction histidine kinase